MGAALTATPITRRSLVRGSDVTTAREQPPGDDWLAIVSRQSVAEFGHAFAAEPVLEASVLAQSIIGVTDIHAFFEVTRHMYERIDFISEHRASAWTCLEWQGKYRGLPLAGATILISDGQGAIKRVLLHHRPLDQLVSFAADLQGRVDAERGRRQIGNTQSDDP